MDTTDVSALTQRIQELEAGNAKLKAILEKNGIEYASFESKTCETSNPQPLGTMWALLVKCRSFFVIMQTALLQEHS